tara:strand:- start:727 stop:1236 length:510 start_codon:yes stop_codon:yes gene_type:complete
MSKSGKWSCVSEVDANQFANCPMQWDNDFHYEIDQNPAAWRRKDHWEWVKAGHIEGEERIHTFYRDIDVDTVDDFYIEKEVIIGAIVESKSSNFTGISVVVREVMKMEEAETEAEMVIRQVKAEIRPNRKPADVERKLQDGRFKSRKSTSSSRTNVRRGFNKQRNSKGF